MQHEDADKPEDVSLFKVRCVHVANINSLTTGEVTNTAHLCTPSYSSHIFRGIKTTSPLKFNEPKKERCRAVGCIV